MEITAAHNAIVLGFAILPLTMVLNDSYPISTPVNVKNILITFAYKTCY